MPNDPYRHHVVPKHYLRAFATLKNPSHIWQYAVGAPINRAERDTPANPRHVPLKVAGMREHFYSFSTGDEVDSATFENELKQREDKYMPALGKLREVESLGDYERFLDQHREDFVECIMVMHQRGFQRRALIERLFARIEGDPRFPVLNEGEKSRYMHTTMLNLDQSMRELLLNNSWLYFRAPQGKQFITSDSPVFAALSGLGMVTFPVSPRYVLSIAQKERHGGDVACDDILDASNESWNDLNSMTAQGAMQHLYHAKSLCSKRAISQT